MKTIRYILLFTIAAAMALPAVAQNPTGTLNGRVTHEGTALPGVTVTVSSPALQGERIAITGANGDYLFHFLPPGDYKVRFDLSSFQPLEFDVRLPAAQTRSIDAEMTTTLVEEIVVTGRYDTISSNTEGSSTVEQGVLEKLPVARNMNSAVLLTPGVNANGPGGNITISGSQSYESLFLVNGVVVNENLRGQALPLFIEDAIQETTTTVSGVSAEYGRFTGGVVNTVTKSGGNEFHGSFRTSFTNDDWTADTPLTEFKADTTNKVYEATFGGYILKDRLWFFLAGRDTENSAGNQTFLTNLPYTTVNSQKRYEGKLTFSPHPNHRIVGSYIEIDSTTTDSDLNYNVIDYNALTDRSDPQDIMSFHYTGVITENFFVEGQYSERNWEVATGGGGKSTDPVLGTTIRDNLDGSVWYNPMFCGVCPPRERNNENALVKGSYFLSTDAMGTHDIVFGYDTFSDIVKEDYYQSASNYIFWSYHEIVGDQVITVVDPAEYNYLVYWPIYNLSEGTDFQTNSLFVNDSWRFNNKLSFNVGLRYDKNDGKNSQGAVVTDDSQLSPRFGASYDVLGDGRWIINAALGRYVGAISGDVANSTSIAGSPAIDVWIYTGEPLNTGGPPYLSNAEVLERVFAWFGSPENPPYPSIYTRIPGTSVLIGDDLGSPYGDEFTIGLTHALRGGKGMVRADYIRREFGDFYARRVDMTTGQVENPNGGFTDLRIIENEDNFLERTYDGLNVSGEYRFSDRLLLGGNWTWSHARGTFVGEASGSGPDAATQFEYPEYRDLSWNSPRGDLPIDERHRFKAWASWDVWVTDYNTLNVSVLQNYWSGTPYNQVIAVDTRPYVTNPGYLTPPTSVNYFLSGRGSQRFDSVTRTDLSVNYSFFWNVFGADLEIYLQPEILNVFNEKAKIAWNTTIYDATTDGSLDPFNPFTETPVEGVNYRFHDDYGQTEEPDDYQNPRTFRFSVGIRF